MKLISRPLNCYCQRQAGNTNCAGKDLSDKSRKAQCGAEGAASCPTHTVVSIVSITSRSDCDGERRVHSSGSQLLSGL